MSLDTLLQEFGTTNKDTHIILVSIRNIVDNEGIDNVANVLLQPQHVELVREIAWELLSMAAPCLTSMSNSDSLNLISYIAEVGRPKEMCIAFLELLEVTVSIEIATLLLSPLRTVIDNIINNELLLSSTLSNVRRFLKRCCTMIKSNHDETSMDDNDVIDNDVMDNEWQQKQVKPEPKPYSNAISFVSSCLHVVDSPIHCIDEYYRSNNGIIYNWSDLQKVCIGILIDLLETVLACNRQIECHTEEKVCNGRIKEEKMVEQIMEYVKLCHCNGLKLLEWKLVTRRRRLNDNINDDDNDDDEDYDYGDDFVLSRDGVAILSCMLLKETCSYLPVVLSHQYRLHLGLVHINHILEVYMLSNHKLVIMVLSLTQSLLQRISNNSLSITLLHSSSIYKTFILLLCNTMTSSPIFTIRQLAVSVLHPLVSSFISQGRYQLYNILLQEVNHAGIKGLLIPRIKDEVNQLLIQQSTENVSSCFIGEELRGLYRQFLIVPESPDILTEFDRYISGLNFIRFLLLKDSPTTNKTLIWSEKQRLQDTYLKPLRSAITSTQIYCKSLLDNPNKVEKQRQRQLHDENENLDVQILANESMAQIPEISKEEEIELLQRSLLRLDIMMSVLSRVEELF